MNKYFKGRNFRDKKFPQKIFSREEIFANLPLICENKFREIYQKFPIRENFFREINQKYPLAKINSAKIPHFLKEIFWNQNRFLYYKWKQVKANLKPLTL